LWVFGRLSSLNPVTPLRQSNEPLDKRLAVTLTMALADPSRQAVDSAPKSSSTPASKDET